MCARVTILKTEKSKPSAVASMENIKNQIQKSLDKGHGGDVFSLKIDQSTKDILKNVSKPFFFLKILNFHYF
jgi:hypothetical protein